jgi:hypothetical protein
MKPQFTQTASGCPYQHLLIASIFISCFLPVHAVGQNPDVINRQAVHFQLKSDKDTVDFIVIDTAVRQKRPVFLFCQGSLPIPLFVHTSLNGVFMIGGGVTNFDVEAIKEHYHLVIISMPKTPLIADEKNLNASYAFIPDSTRPQQPSVAFQRADYLENYVQRAEKVIKFLWRQDWVDHSRLVVAGHSQGSKVAPGIALANKHVTHVGLFGANPFGRIDQMVRQERKEAEQKKITWDEADKRTANLYKYYSSISGATVPDPSDIAWKSFSEPELGDWLKIKRPIYLAYGSNDITSDLCDLVPLFFINKHKDNLTYKRYPGLEHNFFEVDGNGRPDYGKGHWPEVMEAFVQWTLK